MHPVTVVTCLYDIGRENQPKSHNKYRPYSHYRTWVRWLLRLNVPIIFYTSKSDAEYIRSWREAEASMLRLMERELQDLPYYRYYSDMERVARERADFYASRPKLEHVCPMYDVIIHSKLPLMQEITESNPYNSKYFFWIDAGYFRPEEFPSGCSFPFHAPWPDIGKIKALLQDEKRLFLEQRKPLDQETQDLSDDYLHTLLSKDQRIIQARVLGGTREAIVRINSEMASLFSRALKLGYLETEEVLLSILLRRWPELFALYPTNTANTVRDLSLVGKLQVPYPREERLQVFTVCSKNIKSESIKPFLLSVTKLGYPCAILGRDEAWGGWSWRTQLYHEAVKSCKAEVIILCDCTDLFFLAPAVEIYNKYQLLRKDKVVIAGEPCFTYGSHKYKGQNFSQEEMLRSLTFKAPLNSSSKYPNGGFLIGRREGLLSVLESNLGIGDDQAGYYELLHQNSHNIAIDYAEEFCACFPAVSRPLSLSDSWILDQPKYRLTQRFNGSQPCALHFPGQNKEMMSTLYSMSGLDGAYDDPVPQGDYPWVIAIMILVIFIVLVILAVWLAWGV